MELLTASDFVVTASLAFLLSILVAKLVSMAMASDHSTHEPVITLQQERLMVQNPQSERRVEFIDPIQVSTIVKTEQNRVLEEQEQEGDEDEGNKVESNFVEFDSVTQEDIAVEFDVSNVGLLRGGHVTEEEEEVTENNEETEQQRKTEDCEEQRKTEYVEDCKEQSKTEEFTFEASSEKQGKTEEITSEASSEKQGNTEDSKEHRKTEEITSEASSEKESEKQGKTEDCKEQGKTEEITSEAISEKQGKTEECNEQRKTEEFSNETSGVKEIEQKKNIEETPFEKKGVKERNNDDDDDDDDDWEGIERSELEKLFMMATKFVLGGDGDGNGLGSDLQMELYGLHKIATEGPCRESQPMPLKLNARAKWNSWQKLGNMSPEVAMERYIGLLSEKIPGWMKINYSSSAGLSEYEHKGSEVSESFAHDLREIEQESGVKDHCKVKETDLEKSAKK